MAKKDNNSLTVKTTIKKADEIAAHYQHFGFVLKETKQGKKEEQVELLFEKVLTQKTGKLDALRLIYNRVDKKFPLAALIWIIVGGGFVAAYLILKGMEKIKPYAGFAIPLFIICFAIATFLLIIFFVVLANKRSVKTRIILLADRLTGAIKEVPYNDYIEPGTEQTGLISRNIDSIINSNVR